MDLFRKKSVDQLVAESTPLKRTMRTFDLTMLGIGAIIGTGIFVLTGKGALTAGPALSVSFLLAAVCCGFAGLCYAEFAAMAPVSGSAYSYAYLAFGELIAFVIGWDLILEYALQAATVSAGWSGYFNKLLEGFGLHLPVELTAAYGTNPDVTTYFNPPVQTRAYRKNRTLKVTQRTVFTKAAIGYRSADRPQSSVLSRSDLGVSPGLLLKAELGALAAVAEVHDQAQTEPDGETHPGLPVETGDEHEAEYDLSLIHI